MEEIASPFPYAVSIGEVLAHELTTSPAQYIVRLTDDGRVVGIPANGMPAPEAFEADLATPPVVLPPVPREVRNSQLRQALLARPFGEGTLYDAVQAALLAANNPAAVIRWDYEDAALRTDPLVNAIAGSLGLSQSDIDDIFREAVAIH